MAAPLKQSTAVRQIISCPPSPPAASANIDSLEVIDEEQDDGVVPTRPLSLANVATVPSSFTSTISTVPSSDFDDDSFSEASFNSSISSAVSSHVSSPCEARFLAKLFGASYTADLARLGVKVSTISLGLSRKSDPGAILSSLEHGTKTFYVCPPGFEHSTLNSERLVELMELAGDEYDCNGLVICLDKKHPALKETLHALLYVGGTIVPSDSGMLPFDSSAFVLFGLDL